MGRALASLNRSVRGIESSGLFRRGGFAFKRCVRERARNRIGHDFEQLGYGSQLTLIELIEKLMNVILIYGHVL